MELLTIDEVAALLRLNPYTVRRLLREGKLPGIKVGAGQQWRVPKDELEKHLRLAGKWIEHQRAGEPRAQESGGKTEG